MEALRACHVAGIDVVAAFARFQQVPLIGKPNAFEVAAWLEQIRGSTSVAELARRAGLTRHRVARWLSGETQPRLIDFFTLAQAITGRLCDLVAELVPIERVPSLLADYQQRLAARQLAHEEPWTEAILRVLETAAYRASRHAPGMIAATLGIALELEQRCLHKLEQAGVIARGPARFELAASLTVDTRALPKLKAHWSEVAVARLSEPLPEDLFSYNVLSASHTDIARIRQLLLATYREIRTIVEHTERDEGVALVNLQLVHWAPRA